MSDDNATDSEPGAFGTWWTVFKRDPQADPVFIGPVYVQVGTIQTKYGFGLYEDDWNSLGELAGPGKYMLVRDDDMLVVRMKLDATTRYAPAVAEAEVVAA